MQGYLLLCLLYRKPCFENILFKFDLLYRPGCSSLLLLGRSIVMGLSRRLYPLGPCEIRIFIAVHCVWISCDEDILLQVWLCIIQDAPFCCCWKYPSSRVTPLGDCSQMHPCSARRGPGPLRPGRQGPLFSTVPCINKKQFYDRVTAIISCCVCIAVEYAVSRMYTARVMCTVHPTAWNICCWAMCIRYLSVRFLYGL